MNNENMTVYPPYRLVAQFADGARLLFDGLTEAQAQQSMEAAQTKHGDIAWYDGVTDLHYENGKYYKLIPPPPEVALIDLTEYTGPLDENGLPLYGAALSETARDFREIPLDNAAVAVGSEGNGLSAELLAMCDGQLIIPMRPDSESLNAGVAASVIMWEMSRGSL